MFHVCSLSLSLCTSLEYTTALLQKAYKLEEWSVYQTPKGVQEVWYLNTQYVQSRRVPCFGPQMFNRQAIVPRLGEVTQAEMITDETILKS